MLKHIVIVFILASLSICSCKQEGAEIQHQKVFHSNPKGNKKIRWLANWFGEGKKETLIKEIARDFSFLNQDIDVIVDFPQDIIKTDNGTNLFFKTRDSVAKMVLQNSWPYDLMYCDSYVYQQVGTAVQDSSWGTKYLVNFKDERWYIDNHKPNILQTSTIQEIYHDLAPGAFIEGVWNLMYVSSEVEQKLGIKVKEYDMTIDDFIEYAKAVYQYNQTHSDKITFFSMQWDGGTVNLFNHLVMSEIGNTTERPTDPYQVLEKVYPKFENLAQYKPLEQNTTFESSWELKQDKVLFVYSYTWITLNWKSKNPQGEKKMRPCELPSMPGKISYSYPGRYNPVFVIPKNAKNKDEAIKLMKFITSSDVAYKWQKYSKCPTGLRSNAAFNEFGADAFNRLSQHMSKKYNDRLEEKNLAKVLFNLNKSISFKATQTLQGEYTAAQAIEEVKKQLK